MNPFASRACAAELARLLDEPVVGGGRPGSPAALAALAHRVADAAPALEPGAAPRPEFRDALRTRLVAVATVQAATAEDVPAAPVRAPRAAWRGAALAGGMASVVAVSGVAVASEAALPGEAFYGLKRTGESVQLALAGSAADEGQAHLHHASTRLDEVAGLVGAPASALGVRGGAGPVASGGVDPALLTSALAAMDDSTRAGGEAVARAAAEGDPAPLRLLQDWSQEQTAELTGLLPELPESARLRAAVSLSVVAAVAEQVLGEEPDDLPDPVVAPAPAPVTSPDAPGGTPPAPAGTEPGSTPAAAVPESATGEPAAPPAAPAPPPSAPVSEPEPAPSRPDAPLPTGPQPTAPLPQPTASLPAPPTPALPVPVPTLAPLPGPLPTLPLPPVPPAPALPELPLPTLPLPVPGLPG